MQMRKFCHTNFDDFFLDFKATLFERFPASHNIIDLYLEELKLRNPDYLDDIFEYSQFVDDAVNVFIQEEVKDLLISKIRLISTEDLFRDYYRKEFCCSIELWKEFFEVKVKDWAPELIESFENARNELCCYIKAQAEVSKNIEFEFVE